MAVSKISISAEASKWFREGMGVPEGGGVDFFGRVYGETNAHEGFSTGMSRHDQPVQPLVDQVVDGVHYYIEESENWFFEGLDVQVDYDKSIDGPVYYYTPNDGSKLDTHAHSSKTEP